MINMCEIIKESDQTVYVSYLLWRYFQGLLFLDVKMTKCSLMKNGNEVLVQE